MLPPFLKPKKREVGNWIKSVPLVIFIFLHKKLFRITQSAKIYSLEFGLEGYTAGNIFGQQKYICLLI